MKVETDLEALIDKCVKIIGHEMIEKHARECSRLRQLPLRTLALLAGIAGSVSALVSGLLLLLKGG